MEISLARYLITLKIDTYSSRSSSDNDGDAPQKADILEEFVLSLKRNERDIFHNIINY